MATKKDLEDQIKILKTKVKELSSEVKEISSVDTSDLGKNPFRALGLFKKNGKYQMVRIDYNPNTGASSIFSVADSDRNPLSAELATFRFDEVAQDEIFSRLEEESE